MFRVLVVILMVASAATGSDERDRRARAAFAFCPAKGVAEACDCPADLRGPAQTQFARALKEHRPVVLFAYGAAPKCCQGQLVAVTDQPLAGVAKDKPVVVYAPLSGSAFRVIAELPANCPAAQLKEAVRQAQAALAEQPK